MIHKIKKYSTTNTLVILGIILGVLFGSFLPELALQQQVIGQIFISFLKMLVVPLVFSSIFVSILGLGSLNDLKTIGLRTIGLYLLTTALAISSVLSASIQTLFSPHFSIDAAILRWFLKSVMFIPSCLIS